MTPVAILEAPNWFTSCNRHFGAVSTLNVCVRYEPLDLNLTAYGTAPRNDGLKRR